MAPQRRDGRKRFANRKKFSDSAKEAGQLRPFTASRSGKVFSRGVVAPALAHELWAWAGHDDGRAERGARAAASAWSANAAASYRLALRARTCEERKRHLEDAEHYRSVALGTTRQLRDGDALAQAIEASLRDVRDATHRLLDPRREGSPVAA